MSPIVRLHCYPDDDGAFASASGTNLDIHTPDGRSLVDAVLERLRGVYPFVAIRVESIADDGGAVAWHVYRDGLPD